jgi:hypothetical protein
VCTRVGNQWSSGVVIAWVRTDAIRNLHHQCRDLYQSTYLVPLRRSGLILLSTPGSRLQLAYVRLQIILWLRNTNKLSGADAGEES